MIKFNTAFMSSAPKSKKVLQKGFTIVELIVTLSIIALLSILAIPAARGIIISGKVEPTAGDVNKVVTKIRANFAGQGNTPYAAINTAVFTNTARGAVSTLTVTGVGAAATTQHDLGATGSQVTVAPATTTVLGDSFTVTFPTVNESACPGFAAQLGRSADNIAINGTAVKTPALVFNGATAQNLCVANDLNTFVYTFR